MAKEMFTRKDCIKPFRKGKETAIKFGRVFGKVAMCYLWARSKEGIEFRLFN